MKKYLFQLAVHAMFGLGLKAAYAAELPTDNPGYLPLQELALGDQQPTVEVTLSGPVLKMLLQLPQQFGDHDEDLDEAIELLRVVDHIYVRVYEIDDDEAEDMLGLINDTSQKLEAQEWSRIVRVREEEDASVDIHVKLSEDGENLNGLAVMAVEEGDGGMLELVIVNIVGNFNPAYLASIGNQMDIDYLDGVEVP